MWWREEETSSVEEEGRGKDKGKAIGGGSDPCGLTNCCDGESFSGVAKSIAFFTDADLREKERERERLMSDEKCGTY